MNIILAEDDKGHATLIKRNLKRAGIKNDIIHFKNGRSTYDYLINNIVKTHNAIEEQYLLLLDIKMPKMDGIELLSKMKRHPKLAKISIIMITTARDPKLVKRCQNLGCDNYITKPVESDKFVKAIQQMGFSFLIVKD